MIYDTYEQNGRDQRGSRGVYPQQVTNRTRPLDALARVFSENPYTAIIQQENSNNLYISLPDQGVNDVRIDHLRNDLINLLNAPQENSHDQKKQLFLEACCGGNKLFVGILNTAANYQSKRIRRRDIDENTLERNLDFIQDLREGKQRLFTNVQISDIRRDFIDELVENIFDEFLSPNDIELLRNLDLQNKQLREVPDQYAQGRWYGAGVHVEAKGVHYAHRQEGGNNFYIGLAKSDNREGGCCGSCTVEFSLLERGENTQGTVINVYRTADYPESFPPNTYNPSPSVRPEDNRDLTNRRQVVQGAIGAPIRAGMRLNEQHNQAREEITTAQSILGAAMGMGRQEELQPMGITEVAQAAANQITQLKEQVKQLNKSQALDKQEEPGVEKQEVEEKQVRKRKRGEEKEEKEEKEEISGDSSSSSLQSISQSGLKDLRNIQKQLSQNQELPSSGSSSSSSSIKSTSTSSSKGGRY